MTPRARPGASVLMDTLDGCRDDEGALLHREAGIRRLQIGELAHAIAHFQRAIELSPLEPSHRKALRFAQHLQRLDLTACKHTLPSKTSWLSRQFEWLRFSKGHFASGASDETHTHVAATTKWQHGCAVNQPEREIVMKEEGRARDAARTQANIEAAASCVAKAQAPGTTPEQAVRLLRKAVMLRRACLLYWVLLLLSLTKQQMRVVKISVLQWWTGRNGTRGLARVLGSLVVWPFVAGVLLRWTIRLLHTSAHDQSLLNIVAINVDAASACAWRNWRWCGTIPTLLTSILALFLPAARFRQLGDWLSPVTRLASAWMALVISTSVLLTYLQRLYAWIVAELVDEDDAAARSQNSRMPRQAHYYGAHSSTRQQQETGWGSQRERSISKGSTTLHERAACLPAGDVRNVLFAKTHYDSLGIHRGLSFGECKKAAKKAFHRLALKLHPDKTQAELADEAFKRVEEAHRTLTDRKLKDEYDLTLPKIWATEPLYANGRPGTSPPVWPREQPWRSSRPHRQPYYR